VPWRIDEGVSQTFPIFPLFPLVLWRTPQILPLFITSIVVFFLHWESAHRHVSVDFLCLAFRSSLSPPAPEACSSVDRDSLFLFFPFLFKHFRAQISCRARCTESISLATSDRKRSIPLLFSRSNSPPPSKIRLFLPTPATQLGLE